MLTISLKPISRNWLNRNKDIIRFFIFILAFLFFDESTSAQGYNIEIEIPGMEQKKCVLGYYFGKSTYKLDSGYFNRDGIVQFSGKDIHEGIFFMILDNQSYFNFLVGKDKDFKISSQLHDLVTEMKVTGSVIAGDYIAYQKRLNEVKSTRSKASEVFFKTRSRDSVEFYQQKIKYLDEQNLVLRKQLIQKHEDNYLGIYLKALDFPKKQRDTEQDIATIRNKLFQNVTFSDPRLLYAPVFFEKIELYFTRVIPDHAGTIIKEIDWLLQKSAASLPVHQFVMQYLLDNYAPSNGYQYWPVFVYLVQDALLTSDINWLSRERLEALEKEAQNIQKLLPGNTAPDLVLESWKGKKQALHAVNADNIFLYFWDPWCNHCKEITSYLKKLHNESEHDNLKIFAVYTGLSRSLWTDYIQRERLNWIHVYDPLMNSDYTRKYRLDSTPLLYYLDGKMSVRGRFETVEELKNYIAKANN